MSLQIIENPSNIPAGFTDGYQRQNTQSFAVRVGLDTTEPFDNGTTITVPVGGIVEAGGILYRITSPVSITKPNAATAYWLVLVPGTDGTSASLQAVTRPGVWNSQRNGNYFTSGTHNGRRTLNWVSRGNVASPPTANAVFSRTTKTTGGILQLQKGWYIVRLGSGIGGGHGGNGADGGGGGVAGNSLTAETVFFAEKPLYHFKVGGSGQNGVAGSGGTAAGGGGGGGGCGEESVFDGLSTGMVAPGNGGNGTSGASGQAGRGGRNGGTGLNGVEPPGGQGGLGGFGGTNFGGSGGGGGSVSNGGNGGTSGRQREDGTQGGFCNIFRLGN